MLLSFLICYLCLFFMKKLSCFNINFQNSFQDVVYYSKDVLNYRLLGCKTKFEKNVSLKIDR